MTRISRRRMLQSSFALGLSAAATWKARANILTREPAPARIITRGPKHHWFAYYDKLQFDPSMRYVLGMQVDFEHRSPRPDDIIQIGMVDLQDDDRWIELGASSAWGWQQGCMLQWIPGSDTDILWNDRQQGRYVCHILNTRTRQQRTVDYPIYALSPDGKTAVAADFRRINDVRPGYGYVGLPDPHADDLAPSESGIFQVNLETGEQRLIISLAEISQLGTIPNNQPDVKHYFNHLLVNPDGSRFVFLHRWKYPRGNWLTRMLTADLDGGNIRVIDDNGLTSHFIWRDPKQILAFSRQPSHGARFYLFSDTPRPEIHVVGADVMERDGHCSYLPDKQWIVNDTYPDKSREQSVYLYHVPTGRRIVVGRFPAPPEYSGEWRCDTHPRHSPDGRLLVIDAPQPEQGRQMHLIDISRIVG
jgi:hypothetical protein